MRNDEVKDVILSVFLRPPWTRSLRAVRRLSVRASHLLPEPHVAVKDLSQVDMAA